PLNTLSTLNRFATETSSLRVKKQDAARFIADVEPSGAGALVTLTVDPGRGWKIKVSHTVAAAPAASRVRIFRKIDKNDPGFDLTYSNDKYGKVPTLDGVRSYLGIPLWIPVRDFLIQPSVLPEIPDATHAASSPSDTAFTLDLPAAVNGPGAFSFKKGGAV